MAELILTQEDEPWAIVARFSGQSLTVTQSASRGAFHDNGSGLSVEVGATGGLHLCASAISEARKDNEQIFCFDLVAGFDEDLVHGAVAIGMERGLHLHRLDRE